MFYAIHMPNSTTVHSSSGTTATITWTPEVIAKAHAIAMAKQQPASPLDAHKLNTNPLNTHKL